MNATTTQIQVSVEEKKERLDRYLWAKLHGPSRAKIQEWIDAGHVLVNGERRRPAQVIRAGDTITVDIPPQAPTALRPEPIAIDIVYEDDDLLVVNKPAGLVVHPAPGHRTGTLVNALLHYCGALKEVGGRERPGLVHRLDKETSGILVVAKTERAYQGLVAQFKTHTIERRYVAILAGQPVPAEGEIRLSIGRDTRDRKKISVRTNAPKPSITRYRVVEQFDNAAMVELRPLTGRTHQLRVHCAALGHPVLGDRTYGTPMARKIARSPHAPAISRQLLHAEMLGLRHPATQQPLQWHAPLPDDMALVVSWLKREHSRCGPR